MRVTIERCQRCGTRYSYQSSGHGAPALNDGTWCPDCKSVIIEALKSRPRRFEGRMRDITEIPDEFGDLTIEMVLTEETKAIQRAEERRKDKEQCSQCRISGFFGSARRIYPGLIDMENGDAQNIRDVVMYEGPHRGTTFHVSTWRKRAEYSISVRMEWDIEKCQWTGRSW